MTNIETSNEEKPYVIVKHGLYYAPDNMGYTGVLRKAGRYSEKEVAIHKQHSNNSIKVQLASESAEYSSACWEETKIADLKDQLKEALRERDLLQIQAARLKEETVPKHIAEALKREAQDQSQKKELLEQQYLFLKLRLLRVAHRCFAGNDKPLRRLVDAMENGVILRGSENEKESN